MENCFSIANKEDIITRYGVFLFHNCKDQLRAELIDTEHPIIGAGRPTIMILNRHVKYNALSIYILPPDDEAELDIEQKTFAHDLIVFCNHKIIATSSYEELIMETTRYMTGIFHQSKNNPDQLTKPQFPFIEHDRDKYREFVDDLLEAKSISDR